MNRTVGNVMEVKVTIQYKMLGTIFAMSRIVRAHQPSHEPDRLPSGTLASADASVQLILAVVLIADFKPLDVVIKFPATVVSISESIMALECR